MPLRGVSVLVVEDDADHRDLAADILMSLGARVVVAGNGKDALKRLLDGCPDLILCDLRMPVMDGFSFAREVRSNTSCHHVRMVALTAIRDPVAYLRTWTSGFDAHLEKPLTRDKLDEIATRLLGGER
jgi:two-component system sensor histidine kinase/response regulator